MKIQEHINKMGYRDDSPYKGLPFINIESSSISTIGVSKTLIGVGDDGTIKVMKPNKNYIYPHAQTVTEIPVKQKGGFIETGLPTVNAKDYKVKKGETLGAIAKANNISVSELATYNNIDNPNKIKEGQKIVIPEKSKTSFSKIDLLQAYKSNKPIKYDDKKLYKGLDESKIDNHKVILDYYKQNKPKTPYTVIDKKTNTLYQYDENNKLINQFRVGLGKDIGDKFTINSKNKKVDRNVSGAGIYNTVARPSNESYKHEYDNNIVLLENERGVRQAMSIHQLPNSLKRKRETLLNNTDLTDDDFSNGCINCNKEQFEQYNRLVTPGQPVYVLPEEPGNFFTVKNKKLSFTTNKNKEYGQYNFSPKSEEYFPLDIKSKNPTEYKNKFIHALSNEKQKLMKDLNLSSDEYDQLAKRAYGIFGQESSFGQGSWNPKNNYNLEKIYTDLFDTNAERQSRSLGLTQIRMKHVNPAIAQKYGINEDTLYNPYQSAIATMERLTDAYQSVKQPNVRDKYENLTPENVYDYAVTFYNKPETVRLGKASGNNSYVQNVNRYLSELETVIPKNETKELIAQVKYQKGGSVKKSLPLTGNPYVAIDKDNGIYYDPYRKKVVQRDEEKGYYTPIKNKDITINDEKKTIQYKNKKIDFSKHLETYPQLKPKKTNIEVPWYVNRLTDVNIDESTEREAEQIYGLLKSFGKPKPYDQMGKDERLVREAMLYGIEPYGYNHIDKKVQGYKEYIEGSPKTRKQLQNKFKTTETRDIIRKELFSKYLGVPLPEGFYSELQTSAHKPSKSKQNNAVYYDHPDFKTAAMRDLSIMDNTPVDINNLQAYTISRGKDEKGEPYFSYYDIWDLDPGKGRVNIDKYNNPQEIYGRVYKEDLINYGLDTNQINKIFKEYPNKAVGKVSYWNQYQKGGSIMTTKDNMKSFEKYLTSLREEEQDQILNYMDGLDFNSQQEFLKGGKVAWSKYQSGGTPGLQHVEVEGDETIQTNQGELYQFKGKKHSQGGIDILAQGGERIFSEHLKVDPKVAEAITGKKESKKVSYADLSKKYDTTKWSKILKNKDSDQYQKETANLKMAHNSMMLDTIFTAQEMSKRQQEFEQKKGSKIFAQSGVEIGKLYPGSLDNASTAGFNLSQYSDRFVKTNQNNVFYDPTYQTYFFRTDDGRYKEHFKRGHKSQYDYVSPTEQKQEPYNQKEWNVQTNAVPGEMVLPQGNGEPGISPKASTVLDIVDPQRTSIAPVQTLPQTVKAKSRSGNKPKVVTTDQLSKQEDITPLDYLPIKSLPSKVSSQRASTFDINDYKVEVPDSYNNQSSRSKMNLGISSKLAGTLLDIGLAASDKLTVDNPQYRDLRKYPLFSRFVDFDDKEVGRNMALNVQQIQNSNMPEEVKQARIADLNSQYKDYQAKIDFGNAQRYEQKINQDTEKLQNYINANIDQQYQDLERYREKKAKVDFLADQFRAQKKSRIVNSIRSYMDYVDRTNLENQIYADNYRIDPVFGGVHFTQGTKNPLKKQEDLLSQYSQNAKNQVSLPNGATLTMLSESSGLISHADGKTEIVKLKQ